MSKTPNVNGRLYMAREKDPYAYWTSEDGLLRISGWASDGLTVEQIAGHIGITKRRLMHWQGRSLELKNALSHNRDAADRAVENALRKAAVGYEYSEVKTTIEIEPDGTEKRKVEKFKRYSKPDSTAMIFYLKNRKPDAWRDNQQLDIRATVGLVQIVDDVPRQNVIDGEVADGPTHNSD